MCDDDRFGSLQIYMLCATMISLEDRRFTSVHIVCDDKFGSLEVWKFRNLHILCDDDKFGSSEVYTFCVMMISLEVWTFTHCV